MDLIGADSRFKVCVIVPTYNNHKTLKRVLDAILQYTPHTNLIVVNDGATDSTPQILDAYPQITRIDLPKNRGKGIALRTGIKKAREMGYTHAITMDSDGQHFASDIPNFLKTLEGEPETLFIGSRNMDQEGVPKKSSFGNKFSNFWFWFETGNKLSDTQSGFRLYPLGNIPKRFFTYKFEFEIEVIVRSAWMGTKVKNIPINISYDPAERVSHFRPFKDFTRISILNTVLVTAEILYIIPRNYVLKLKKKGVKKFLLENVLHNQDSNTKKALSIALGVFVGLSPAWGFHTALALFFAVLFRLNKVIAFAFSNVSIPPFIPFIVYSSIKVASFITHKEIHVFLTSPISFSSIQTNIQYYILGSLVLATVMSAVFGLGGFLILSIISNFKGKK